MPRFFGGLRKRWKLILLVVVVLAGIGFFIYKKRTATEVKQTFIQPTHGDLVQTLDVSGVVDAKEKASLRFAAGGRLIYLGASEGATLKPGQTIARIDNAELQKRLQQDLNNYFKERMDFEQGAANRQDIAPTNALNRTAQQDQKTLENSVLDVEIQQIAIRNANLLSPFAGILVSMPTITIGSNVLSTDVFEIVNPNSLVFRATVDQADVAKVKKGQPVEIELDPYPDQPLSGQVSYISLKSSQTSTGTVYLLEVPFGTANDASTLERYRLGMNGDAKIELDRHTNVLKIPLNATKERDNKTYVQLKGTDGKITEHEIQVGLQNEDDTEVTGGLTEQDQILLP